MAKINILHVVLSLETGGLERIVTEIVSGIDKSVFNSSVCCLDRLGEFADIVKRNGINVSLLKRNQKRYDYFFPFKLRKMLLMKDIHILHLHSGTFFLGAQAGILARTPIMVYTDHGRLLGETKIQLITDKISGFLVDKIVAVSKELGKYLKNIVGLQTQKIIVIENGINTGVFTDREKPEHLMREFNIPNNCKVIGTVGRLAEVKDQLTLIEAFKIVNDKIPNTMLIIVGDGPMYNQLDDAVKKTGLSHNVRLLGNIKDVDQLINIFDVFLLTSLSEGTSVSLLEAMSAGIAPIVTDVGGNLSIIEDQTNGLLVKPRQPRQIADNILKLLLDDNYRSVLSHEAQNTVRNKYSIHMMNRKYTELYTDLIKEKRLNLLD